MILLAILIAFAQPAANIPCPETEEQVAGFDWIALPSGCKTPRAGALYTFDAHKAVAAEIAGLEALAKAKIERLADCRADLKTERSDHAASLEKSKTQIRGLSEKLEAVADPPSRLNWSLIGAGAALIVFLLVDDDARAVVWP